VIPYVEPPAPFFVLGLRVSVFGWLLLAAVVAAYAVIVRRGRALDERGAERVAQVLLGAGVVGAHVGGVIVDHGAGVLGRPALLLSTQGSFSSAGGLLAAAVVGGVWLWRTGRDMRAWADVVAGAFPVGLFLARAGCALAHDHPGRLSDAWIAVRFPEGARLDCGLLEWMAAPALVALVWGVGGRGQRTSGGESMDVRWSGEGRRWSPPRGGLAGVVGAAYVLVRFPLDFLRAKDLPGADARWLGLTFAQWLCLPLFVGCAGLVAPWVRAGVRGRDGGRRGCRASRP
jgi:phosphatidylglycerol:prolipoprotein diacylglycerol transferase